MEIPQASWSGSWQRPVAPELAHLLAKIEKAGRPLEVLYRPISGINVTNRPEAGLKPFLSQEPLDGTYHKAIFSGNISPYILRWPTREQEEARGRKRKYICYDRDLARAVNQYLAARGRRPGSPSAGVRSAFASPSSLSASPWEGTGALRRPTAPIPRNTATTACMSSTFRIPPIPSFTSWPS